MLLSLLLDRTRETNVYGIQAHSSFTFILTVIGHDIGDLQFYSNWQHAKLLSTLKEDILIT